MKTKLVLTTLLTSIVATLPAQNSGQSKYDEKRIGKSLSASLPAPHDPQSHHLFYKQVRDQWLNSYFLLSANKLKHSESHRKAEVGELAVSACTNDDGTVTARWGDGSSYSGEVFFGEIRGKGTMIYPDGSRYEGAWEADLPNGEGIFTDSTGTAYAVRWIDGLPHGKGTITRSDGTRYDARWRRGKLRARSVKQAER